MELMPYWCKPCLSAQLCFLSYALVKFVLVLQSVLTNVVHFEVTYESFNNMIPKWADNLIPKCAYHHGLHGNIIICVLDPWYMKKVQQMLTVVTFWVVFMSK